MKVAYLTNVIPSYRTAFFANLLADDRLKVTVYCHGRPVGESVKWIPERLQVRVVRCQVILFSKGAAIFECLPVLRLLRDYDVIVSDGNPRHIGFAFVSTLAALFGKRVVIWSTLHSRRNRALTHKLRLIWWGVFREFLSYTEPDAVNISAAFPRARVKSANNGLDQRTIDAAKASITNADVKHRSDYYKLADQPVLISLGRVLPGRFDLMVSVLAELRRNGIEVKWILLGDGPSLEELRAKLQEQALMDHVVLAGAVHDESELARWFCLADVFVYPEAIGLSLYHAFGYGLPVVTHSDLASHGPEMAAFEEGRTGITFNHGDAKGMATAITRLIRQKKDGTEMGQFALRVVQERYNSSVMYENFISFILSGPTANKSSGAK